MAHIEKSKGSKAAALIRHDERAQGVKDAHIDPSLLHLNYNLCDRGDGVDYMNSRIREITQGKKPRKDMVKSISVIVTCPKDLPENEREKFLLSAYEFCKSEFGEKNIICAWVHRDEPGAQPHIHVKAVPCVVDKKTQTEKVCAKELITRGYLKRFHPKLQKHIESELGHSVSIINGATAEKNREIAELKAETALQRAAALEQQIDDCRDKLVPLQAKYESTKTYVEEMATNFNLANGIEPIKRFGKLVAYKVPPSVLETQRVTQMDRTAHLKAVKSWEQKTDNYDDIVADNKRLIKRNNEMILEIEKIKQTVCNMSAEAQNEFFRRYNTIDDICIPQPLFNVKSIENELEEREEGWERSRY